MLEPSSAKGPPKAQRRAAEPNSRRALIVILFTGLIGLGACSAVPDALNPVEWYRSVAGGSDAEGAALPPKLGDIEEVEAVPGAEEDFPKLATVPDAPPEASSPEDLRRLSEGLVADRARARYTEEDFRQRYAVERGVVVSEAVPAEVSPPAGPTTPPATVAVRPRVEPSTRSPTASTPEPMTTAAFREMFDAKFEASGRSPTASGSSYAEAPLLRPPEPLATEALAALAPAAGGEPSSLAASPAQREPDPGAAAGEGLALASVGDSTQSQPAVSFQATVILFRDGSARLSANDRRALRDTAGLHRTYGGTIRVIGHASLRTRDMDLTRHKLVNFQLSLDRANAVAEELIRQGVAPEAVHVSAMGDTQPLAYEFMPAGEAENRRAEVLIEY